MAGMPVRAIVTTGPVIDPAQFRSSVHVTVVATAPHSEVLKVADAVVTHGVHGTVVRALAAGVPLVVLPQGRDQADNAARVSARGAGVRIERSATPATMAAAVCRLLNESSYRDAAERLGCSIRDDAISGALVRELEDLCGPVVDNLSRDGHRAGPGCPTGWTAVSRRARRSA